MDLMFGWVLLHTTSMEFVLVLAFVISVLGGYRIPRVDGFAILIFAIRIRVMILARYSE